MHADEPFAWPALAPPTPRRRPTPAPTTAPTTEVAQVQAEVIEAELNAVPVADSTDTERGTEVTVDAGWSFGRWLGRLFIFISITRRRC